MSYSYDGNGNLLTKTDPRKVVTTYAYDEVNRVTSRSYDVSQASGVAATPSVTYAYDAAGVLHARGRLTGVISNVSSTGYDEYDALGRVKKSSQTTAGVSSPPYAMLYSYDRAGNLTSETYPSGRVVNMEYDPAGRLAGVKKDASTYYAGGAASDATNRVQYAAHGAVSKLRLGNGLWEHTLFNTRLQPTEIGLGTTSTDSSKLRLDYTYGTTANNGNLLTQRLIAPGLDRTQTYSYDALNRLNSVTEPGTASWSRNFGYDRFGNGWVSSNSGVPLSTLTPLAANHLDPATNRLTLSTQFGASAYDPAGNLTADASGAVMAYDGESRLVRYTQASLNQTASYFYDGDGRRVKKVVSQGGVNQTTVFVYNAFGQLVAEYSDPQPPVEGGTKYLTADHLGSTRVVTDGSGTVKARHDYLPFGEESGAGIGGRTVAMGYITNDSTRQRFTSKERDGESGLDYFLARYYSAAQGRFTSVDPENAGADPDDPQSWNGYAYARNNPMVYVDPDGLRFLVRNPDGTIMDLSDAEANALFLNEEWAKSRGLTVIKGVNQAGWLTGEIYDSEGNRVAQFTRVSFDDFSPDANAIFGEVRRNLNDPLVWAVGAINSKGKSSKGSGRNKPGTDEGRPSAVGVRVPAPKKLPAFPSAERAKPKTPVQGGGGLRPRWKDDKGNIYEWDSLHGKVEKYDKRGRHLGEFDPNTGVQTKPENPNYKVKP